MLSYVLVSPHPCQQLLLILYIFTSLMEEKWHLIKIFLITT